MNIGTADARPGELSRGYLEVTQLPTGAPERLPVVVAEGAEPGPSLWVAAAIHSDETTSLAAAHDFADRLRPDELAGRVVCLPNLNPAGLRRNSRTSYYHGDDPNRYFPAGPTESDGSSPEEPEGGRPPRVQELIDGRVFELVSESADALVSLHTSWVGSASYTIRPRVTYGKYRSEERAAEIESELVALTEAFGLPAINQFGHRRALDLELHRSLAGAAVVRAGIPAFTPELGGRYVVEEDARRAGVEGLENVLRELDMVDEPTRTDADRAPPVDPPLRREVHPHAETPGIVRYRVDAGDPIAAGDPVADIVTPHGEPKATVRTDHDGYVLSRHEGAAVYEHDPLLDIAVPDDEPLVVPYDGE